jgi:hypothetical protein
MKSGIVAALMLLWVPAAGITQRAAPRPSDGNLPAPARAANEPDADSAPPRVAPAWNDRTERDNAPAPRRSLYGAGIRTPWQDNPIRTPWQ